jgi:hypothetical protein
MNIVFDVRRGLLGFQEKLSLASNTKRVVRGLGGRSYTDSVLMDNVLVSFRKSLLVIDVPSQGLEERINEFSSNLSFVVMPGFVGRQVIFESFYQVLYLFGCRQISLPRDALTIAHRKRLCVMLPERSPLRSLLGRYLPG